MTPAPAAAQEVQVRVRRLSLNKLFSKKFAGSGSPAVKVLRKFKWSNADQNFVANLVAGQHMDPAKAAQAWIKTHPKQVKQWLS